MLSDLETFEGVSCNENFYEDTDGMSDVFALKDYVESYEELLEIFPEASNDELFARQEQVANPIITGGLPIPKISGQAFAAKTQKEQELILTPTNEESSILPLKEEAIIPLREENIVTAEVKDVALQECCVTGSRQILRASEREKQHKANRRTKLARGISLALGIPGIIVLVVLSYLFVTNSTWAPVFFHGAIGDYTQISSANYPALESSHHRHLSAGITMDNLTATMRDNSTGIVRGLTAVSDSANIMGISSFIPNSTACELLHRQSFCLLATAHTASNMLTVHAFADISQHAIFNDYLLLDEVHQQELAAYGAVKLFGNVAMQNEEVPLVLFLFDDNSAIALSDGYGLPLQDAHAVPFNTAFLQND